MKDNDDKESLSREMSGAEVVRILFWSILMIVILSAKYWIPENPTTRDIFIGPSGIFLVAWITAIGWVAWKIERKLAKRKSKNRTNRKPTPTPSQES